MYARNNAYTRNGVGFDGRVGRAAAALCIRVGPGCEDSLCFGDAHRVGNQKMVGASMTLSLFPLSSSLRGEADHCTVRFIR